jgi:hypothetical protein
MPDAGIFRVVGVFGGFFLSARSPAASSDGGHGESCLAVVPVYPPIPLHKQAFSQPVPRHGFQAQASING